VQSFRKKGALSVACTKWAFEKKGAASNDNARMSQPFIGHFGSAIAACAG